MDYSQLSDQEINMLVAKIQHPDKNFIESKTRPPSVVLLNHINNWVDYCNNPADAWPIIESSNISINNDAVVDEWVASHGGVIYQHCRGKRPLRLAMECFLKIQDANHA